MFARIRNIIVPFLLFVLSTLACGISTPTQSPEDALATQVRQTLEAHEAQVATPPSETEVVSSAGSFHLLFLELQDLYALDVRNGETHHLFSLPSMVDQKDIYLHSEAELIVYRGEGASHVLELSTGQVVFTLADQEPEREIIRYRPRAWIDAERFLAQRYHYVLDENDAWTYTSQIGWLSITDGAWHPLPAQGEMVFSADCSVDVAINPDGRRVALALYDFGQGCAPLDPGLYILNLEDGSVKTVVSREAGQLPAWKSGGYSPMWSSDGAWIAVSLVEPLVAPDEDPGLKGFPNRLYVVHPDGSDLTQLTWNATGIATGATWDRTGRLYYGLIHSEDEANAIFVYNFVDQSHTMLLEGNALPASISPNEDYLVYMDDIGISHYLRVMSLSNAEILEVPAPSGGMSMGLEFVGWQMQE